jgi:4a-hydroxytetrahydrobiopterin dehydratase
MTDRVEVTFYTRKGCHLCHDARKAIDAAARMYALPLAVREIDIDGEPELMKRYTNEVPVIAIDGETRFRHRLDVEDFAAAVRARMGHRTREGASVAKASKSSLAKETCVPCRGGVPPLKGKELTTLAKELGGGWRVVEDHHLEKEFKFPDFAQALELTNRIGAVAEAEGHHPDIYLGWGKVRVTIWTHKIDGLTRSDFVLAAKIDEV